MKEILNDIVTHIHALEFLSLVKIASDGEQTIIESMAEDKSVIVTAKTHTVIPQFEGVFGMPNLDKLELHLKNPEYKTNAKISVIRADRNGKNIPTHIHFENETGDFKNDYRFMLADTINEKLKTVKFRGAKWNIEFEPSAASVTRMALQSKAHSDNKVFQVQTDSDSNLVVLFGNAATHTGSFVFEHNVSGSLKTTWAWPVKQVLNILNLSGNKVVKISDAGAMQIDVDSGLAVYEYILPAIIR
jgi:hypothetical protein